MAGQPSLKFFVPFAESQRQAERVYRAFAQHDARFELYHPESRLYELKFRRRGEQFHAVVGQELFGWRYPVGPVLAIIETRGPLCIHTRLQGGISTTPIYVSADSVWARRYFDDFPALTVSGGQDI